jgi:hypothetical protein
MDKAEITKSGVEVDGDGLFADCQQPFELGGALFFPAVDVRTRVACLDADGSKLVQLDMLARSMLGNHVGTFLRMTPEGARTIARALIDEAQKVDAHVAEQAAAAIEKARTTGMDGAA